jgi:two-component system, LytTR family, sensor kinase
MASFDMPPPRSRPASDEPSAQPDERRLRRLGVLAIIGFFVLEAFLRTGYFHFGARAAGDERLLADTLISEITGSLATVLVFFAVVLPACRRWPVRGPGWPRSLAAHGAALLVFSALKTLLMWGSRAAVFPLAGLGAYDYGEMLFRFPMELSNDVVGYFFLAFAVHVWDAWGELREREIREARLEARLGEARLQALQGQLRPHFLFNTLNTISSVMYRDPDRADRLLARLSDLLRSSLAAPGRPEVTVEEELHALEQYLEIMRARFEGSLAVEVVVDDAAREGLVPVFALQPLVENAIRHGAPGGAVPGTLAVRVERNGPRLRLVVEDDGPGIRGDPMEAIGRGVGLSNTRERLEHMYGDRAGLFLENREGGGLRATVDVPWRRAEHPPAPGERPAEGGSPGARREFTGDGGMGAPAEAEPGGPSRIRAARG